MSDSRQIHFDIEALLLSGLCLFLWLSLASYDPADAVAQLPGPLSRLVTIDPQVYPVNVQPTNYCGWIGATCAQLMIQSLGVGSILVAIGMSVLAIWMFRVQSNYVRASRQIGWVLVILSVTTWVSLLDWHTPLAPVIGAGGYLGATTSTWLNAHFALVGSLILTFTIFVAGLLLSTDYVVVRALAMMLAGGAAVASTAAAATKQKVALPTPASLFLNRRRKSDVEQGVDLAGSSAEAEESHPPIRIRGVQLDGRPTTATAVSPTGRTGLMGAAQAVANGLLGGVLPALSTPTEGVANRPTTISDELRADDEEYDEDEFDPEGATPDAEDCVAEEDGEQDDVAESRELEVGGETLQVRADDAHTATAADQPRVRAPKKKKEDEAQRNREALAHLDDTKLPAGAEEYVLPGLDLLLESDDIDFESQTIEVRRKAKILEKTFKDFNFNVKVVEIETGPVIAQYEIELEAGLRLSKITSLSEDLAIALRVPSVRIVAPIPGKNTVGIEVPNEVRQVVRLREVIEEQGAKGKKAKIPMFLGKDVSGNALVADLATLPHLLIAGRTGTGKSVCLNALIASILMTKRPDEVRMLMIDPKMVELSGYARLPHLMHPVVTDMRKAEAILAWAVDKMEERYALLARAGVRHLTNYNELGREELIDRLKPETPEEADAIPDHLPFIVIIADEMADLMMTAGKEVEQHIIRLAQKSRAVGIHLILATQKPTVDVITGLIKSNLPARISFQVASRTDSRVVLDEMGADKLLGNGDMLFMGNGTSMLLRGQGTYLSDEEINQLVDHCSTGEQNFVHELVNLKVKEEGDDEGEATPGTFKKRDDLYEAAVDLVVREGRGSSSLLQRALGIGYGRAARLIDFMAEDGIVGQYNGSQAREVAISIAEWEAMRDGSTSSEAAITPSPPRSNKIQPLSSSDESGPVRSHHLTSAAETVSAATATASINSTTRGSSTSGSTPAASPKRSVRNRAADLEKEDVYEEDEYAEELEDSDADNTAEEFEEEEQDGEEEYEDYEDV
ncbi:MAG: DNA translocase FtsK 4TM domain-containing protein [Pirellulaceae bacterium]|jgi:S-DNA-T family DNA segregation ATPase FtsK/SpoIIIE|nr:DNA translocase FtsK 4TM domain-containing protein [Pirellulaceae bacterium]